uniref:ML domain-containing protein n=1 Tax=Parastrongyloides trichosuri TaxID=131310 RepID=A0A0N5A2W2_PARTI
MAFAKLSCAIIFLISLFSTIEGCDTFPNGTETKLHWYAPIIRGFKIIDIQLSYTNGSTEYPLALEKTIYVQMELINNGPSYYNLNLTLQLWSFGGWQGCSWHLIPTFGLLRNLDACSYGLSCPIPQGKNEMSIKLDLSPFDSVISLLQNDKTYQLQYVLTDRDTGDETCLMIQARSLTH